LVSKYSIEGEAPARARRGCIRQLDDEETQPDALKKKKQDTEAQQQLANGVLQKMIQELQMDVTL